MMERIAGIFTRLVLTVAVAVSAATVAYSQDTRAQEDRKARLEKEIAIIDNQLKANAKQSSSALSNLSLIRKKVASRKELLEESDKKIAAFTSAIQVKEKEIAGIKARLDTLSQYNARLIRSAYKNRSAKVWYMYILASDNLGQAFRRFGYLRDLSKQMNIQATKIKEAQKTLEEETAALAVLKKEAEEVRAQRLAEVNKLQSEQNESQQVVNQLNKDKRKYQQQLNKKRQEVEALNREIERIIRQAIEEEERARKAEEARKAGSTKQESTESSASSSKASKPRTTVDVKLAGEFAKNKGKLPWPADGPVVDKFGQHYHPVYTKVKLPFNNGISIALQPGTEVRAVFDGTVKQVIVMPGYNKCVLVQHGSYFSFYCKLADVSVKAGDKVKTGQRIGTVDTIGGDTQLHFQIWSGKNPQNPELWLRP